MSSRSRLRAVAEMAALSLVFVSLFCALALTCFSAFPATSDFMVPLGGGYELVRSSAHVVHVSPAAGWNASTPRIPEEVLELAHDDTFVLAKQIAPVPGSRPRTWALVYWILDVTGPRVFGPLTEEEFAAKRTALGVSPSLILRSVYTFRPWYESLELQASAFMVFGVVLFLALLWVKLGRSRGGARS